MRFRSRSLVPSVFLALLCTSPFLIQSFSVRAQSPTATGSDSEAAVQALPFDRGAAALWQSLQKLRTRASLLMVTAHPDRSEEHTSELQSPDHLVCRLLLEKK